MSSTKEFLDRVKKNQAIKAAQEPQIRLEVSVKAMDNGQVMVTHPDTEDIRAIAQFIDLLSVGIQTLCRAKLTKQDKNRIIPVTHGMVKLQG